MHPDVHSSTIYNSSDVEATVNAQWQKNEDAVYTMEYYSATVKNKKWNLQQHGWT